MSTIAHACTECVPVAILNDRQVAESIAEPADLSGYTRAKQELVAPPFAPAHEQVATSCPKIIEITMETTERLMLVYEDAGASVWALTCCGSVPGPPIICHQDDMTELTRRSPIDRMMEHNIDFHASTGALAGEHALTASVGETVPMIHNQAARDSRPHLIGRHGNYVRENLFTEPRLQDMARWFVRGGSAVAAMYTFEQPGV
ncbi:hypothetical protein [Boseongicola aestuarii]|uniref:hypothetical protein n=1 Tax=Boseongicola aestuarii TaxID=1470561 RepID=UPI001FEA98B4|nr:hypothetical protein [Boseongicola aestuarii]